MKFFTKKMYLGFQNDRDNYWYKIWKKNLRLYNKHLEKIRYKLSKRVFEFFYHHHRHDDYIVDVNIINNGKAYIQDITNEIHLKNASKRNINIDITTLCPTKTFYVLHYREVKRYIIDFPMETSLWIEGPQGYGWAYDELSYSGNGYFRHEILLHSGATILIEFKKFNYSCQKIRSISRVKNKSWQDVLEK